MHRVAILLFVTGLPARPAIAQPVLRPSACDVTIVMAPDDVRGEIEDAIRAEPRCSARFDLRVIPTDGGLYLFARDDHGRVRERVVPDAKMAALLVASWVSDVSMTAPSVEVAPIREPVATPAPQLTWRADVLVTASRRWLTVGLLARDRGAGARAQLDLLGRGRWTLGVAGSIGVSDPHDESFGGDATRSGTIGTATVYVGAAAGLGGWGLRAQLGAGFAVGPRATWSGYPGAIMRTGEPTMSDGERRTGLVPAAEAALLASHALGRRWGITGGPVVTVVDNGVGGPQSATVSLFAGLQHRW